jgi:hypothetical protein
MSIVSRHLLRSVLAEPDLASIAVPRSYQFGGFACVSRPRLEFSYACAHSFTSLPRPNLKCAWPQEITAI